MPDPALVIVDDSGFTPDDVQLSPATDLRATFDLRIGAFTTLERLSRRMSRPSCLSVPNWLEGVTRERHPNVPINDLASLSNPSGGVFLVNGRAPLAHQLCGSLLQGQCLIDRTDPSGPALIAAWASTNVAQDFLKGAPIESLGLREVASPTGNGAPASPLLRRPWHLRAMRDACLHDDLRIEVRRLLNEHGASQLPVGTLCEGTEPFFVDESANIFPGVVLDFSSGPIWIDAEATIRPGAVLTGPCYVGEHSHVLDRAVIRAGTSIGPWCKVAGEVGGTTFQGFSNKAHDGYIGDSYVGEWVNLGAGTTGSNLLNTYGEIITRPLVHAPNDRGARAMPGPNESTGQTFLGCTLGDHVKTAICTRIMTGAIVGTGTMFAAGAPLAGTVPSFSWCTDTGVKPYRFEKFVEVAQAAMQRRKVAISAGYAARLRQLCP